MPVWENPPFSLLARVEEKILREGANILLLCPEWGGGVPAFEGPGIQGAGPTQATPVSDGRRRAAAMPAMGRVDWMDPVASKGAGW